MASPAIYAPLVMRQPSAADYASQWQDLEASKTRNALANFGMQQAREKQAADAQRQNVLREIANLPPEQQAPAMQRAGLWAEAQGLEKHRADLLKTDAEARAKSAETVAKKAATWRQALDFVRTPDDLRRYSAAVYSDPDMRGTPFTATPIEQWMQAIPDDPAQFADLHRRLSLGMEKYIAATAPKYVNAGGAQVQTNPLATAKDIPITQSPDNAASVAASMANAAATRAAAAENASATRDAARITARASDETGLRKEFADLPEVKKYKNAIPAYQAIKDAAKTNNPQADINLVYGVAKLYDPDSVVREGEYATIAGSQSIPEWLKGQAQFLSGGGGKLTAETKKQILTQARNRIDAYRS